MIGIVVLLLASGFVFYSYDRSDDGVKLMSDDDYKDMQETNYVGLIKLGLAPSTSSRQPLRNDIDTGIKLTDGDNNVYSLMESRTFVTKDYGKTFVVKIN